MLDEYHKEIVTGDCAQGRLISELAPDLRETIAQAIHEAYRRAWRGKVHSRDLSIAKWDKLPDYLKESNRQQADHIFDKLHRLGCTVHKVTERDIVPIEFTEDEIENMAKMEHARWNEERLGDGWRWGKKRDIIKKTSPYLVPWDELSEEAKDEDRNQVRDLPAFLAKARFEIYRTRKMNEGES